MSIAGTAPPYALDPPVSNYVAFLAYHINGQTYGGEPAPTGLEQTFVVHAMADFVSTIPEPNTLLLLALGLAAVVIANNTSARRRR